MIYVCDTFWTLYAGPLATLIGVLLSGLIAYILFNAGIKKERRLNAEFRQNEKNDALESEKKRINDYNNYLIALLDQALKNIKKQNEFYKDYVDLLIHKPKQMHFPMILQHEHLKQILKIDNDIIYKVFSTYFPDNVDFIDFNTYIAFSSAAIKKMNNVSFKTHGEQVKAFSNRATILKRDILNIAADFISKNELEDLDRVNETIYKSVSGILKDYYKNYDGNPDLDWDYEKLMKPLKESLAFEDIMKTEIGGKLLEMSMELGDTIHTVKYFNEGQSKDVASLIPKIQDSYDVLMQIKDKLEKRK